MIVTVIAGLALSLCNSSFVHKWTLHAAVVEIICPSLYIAVVAERKCLPWMAEPQFCRLLLWEVIIHQYRSVHPSTVQPKALVGDWDAYFFVAGHAMRRQLGWRKLAMKKCLRMSFAQCVWELRVFISFLKFSVNWWTEDVLYGSSSFWASPILDDEIVLFAEVYLLESVLLTACIFFCSIVSKSYRICLWILSVLCILFSILCKMHTLVLTWTSIFAPTPSSVELQQDVTDTLV